MPSREPQGDSPKKSIYMPYGASGGGGEGGTYVFTDLAHLDNIVTRWKSIHDAIAVDGLDIGAALQRIVPPAHDRPSVAQARATRESLDRGHQHNEAMVAYAKNLIEKLEATRVQYATSEETNTETIRNADEQR